MSDRCGQSETKHILQMANNLSAYSKHSASILQAYGIVTEDEVEKVAGARLVKI